MLYLIMRCDELDDQFECDADRTPIAIVEDWKNYVDNHHIDYDYEIWQYDNNNHFSCIKEYTIDMEKDVTISR